MYKERNDLRQNGCPKDKPFQPNIVMDIDRLADTYFNGYDNKKPLEIYDRKFTKKHLKRFGNLKIWML